MGIKGLTKEIKKMAPSAIQTLSYQELAASSKHKLYGVDVFSYLYPTQYNAANKGKGNHIREFMEMIVTWASHGVRLIFVFDGNTHSDAKRDTIDERVERRIKGQVNIQRLIQEILDTEKTSCATQAEAAKVEVVNTDLNKLGHAIMASSKGTAEQRIELEMALRTHIIVSGDKINDLVTLFQLVGATYMQAEGEADFLLASLYKNGYIDGVISEDTDMLTHGVAQLVRGITDPSLRRTGNVSVYSLTRILNEAKISMNQFIDFCILCGCDYCPKINGVAGTIGLRLLRSHTNIANIVSAMRDGNIKYRPAGDLSIDEYLSKYERAFCIFSREQESLPPFSVSNYAISDGFIDWIINETNYTKGTLLEKINILEAMKAKEAMEAMEEPDVAQPIPIKIGQRIKIKAKLKSMS